VSLLLDTAVLSEQYLGTAGCGSPTVAPPVLPPHTVSFRPLPATPVGFHRHTVKRTRISTAFRPAARRRPARHTRWPSASGTLSVSASDSKPATVTVSRAVAHSTCRPTSDSGSWLYRSRRKSIRTRSRCRERCANIVIVESHPVPSSGSAASEGLADRVAPRSVQIVSTTTTASTTTIVSTTTVGI
jgi:hypothetical protein